MTDNITSLAKQAGFDQEEPDDYCREEYWTATKNELQRFAELVRNEALEEAAKAVESEYDNWDNERPLRICATKIRRIMK